ncbi:MAG: hypothetical protein NVS3B27_18120 [Novosphingobium sp.]
MFHHGYGAVPGWFFKLVALALIWAYLHHLTKAGEMLGAMLLTEHNLAFYQALMAGLRAAIAEDRMAGFAADFLREYEGAR